MAKKGKTAKAEIVLIKTKQGKKGANHVRASKSTAGGFRTVAPQSAKDEAAYLYGFVDPTNAARGPMGSEHPTIVTLFQSVTTVTLLPPTATPGAYTGSVGAVTSVPLTGIVAATRGDIVVAVGPTFFTDKRAGFLGSHLSPAFVIDPTRALNIASVDTGVSGKTSIFPIGAYTSAYPGVIETTVTDQYQPLADGITSQAHRVVGLRATLTVNGNVLDATGMVYASDNCSYYPDEPARNYDQNVVTGVVNDYPIYEDADIYAVGLGNGSITNRSVVAGPFAYGKQFEATFMPTADNILAYRNKFPTVARCTLGNNEQTTASLLMDGPYVFFHLMGVTANVAITITTQLALELPVRLGPISVLGFLLSEARLSRKYTVDWDMLSPVPVGGHLLAPALAAATQSFGRLGLAMAAGSIPPPHYNRCANLGLSVPSSTSMLSTLALDGRRGDDIQERISSAASTTRTPTQVYREGTRKLQEKHGKSGGEIAAGVVEGAIGVAGGLYNAQQLMQAGRAARANPTSLLSRIERAGAGILSGVERYGAAAAGEMIELAPLMIAAGKRRGRA
jgi:hypothetical protein